MIKFFEIATAVKDVKRNEWVELSRVKIQDCGRLQFVHCEDAEHALDILAIGEAYVTDDVNRVVCDIFEALGCEDTSDYEVLNEVPIESALNRLKKSGNIAFRKVDSQLAYGSWHLVGWYEETRQGKRGVRITRVGARFTDGKTTIDVPCKADGSINAFKRVGLADIFRFFKDWIEEYLGEQPDARNRHVRATLIYTGSVTASVRG